jgi:release factor glutamine methyltransferase
VDGFPLRINHCWEKMRITKGSRNKYLLEVRGRQPYTCRLDGLEILVKKDVFPPDIGMTSQLLAFALKAYRPAMALDMGSGTGYLAMTLKRAGVHRVIAADHHQPAIDCMKKN